MTNRVTLYHAGSRPGTWKQWSIWRTDDNVTVEWGLVGHTLQRTGTTAKPKGKLGTASYQNPIQSAEFEYARQIRKKTEEGYLPTMTTAEVQPEDFFDGLTKNFVPAKPRNDQDQETLIDLSRKSNVYIQRKRDGQRHLVLITSTGDVKIYSRRIDDMTAHLPRLCAAIKKLKLAKGTILDGELLVVTDGKDDLRAMGTITRSKVKQAAEREAAMTGLKFMVFDVLYHRTKPVWERPYAERYDLLTKMIGDEGDVVFVSPNLSPKVGLAQWMSRAKASGWEGLVVWNADEATVVRHGGKPKRVNCAKWKPIKEKDVVATGFNLGSGDKSALVGALNIGEYLSDGTWRDCGKVGSGFTMEVAEEALTWTYPCVVSIEYATQQADTGKFQFPVFLKLHEDKRPKECVFVPSEEEE